LSINRQRIVDAAVAGYGVPATHAVPPGVFSDDAELGNVPSGNVPSGDVPSGTATPGTAAALLDSARWQLGADGVRSRDGTRLEVTLITVGSGDLAAEQLLQDDFRRVGIALTIRTVELAAFLASLRAEKKDFDVAYTGLPGDVSLGHLSSLFHSAQRGGALDYTGYHTSDLDSLLDHARRAPTVAERQTGWHRVSAHLDSFAPVAFVYHGRGVQGRARSLEGVVMDLRGELTSIARWRRRE
jgi:peptide/nickel transport system substrate-binding protein